MTPNPLIEQAAEDLSHMGKILAIESAGLPGRGSGTNVPLRKQGYSNKALI